MHSIIAVFESLIIFRLFIFSDTVLQYRANIYRSGSHWDLICSERMNLWLSRAYCLHVNPLNFFTLQVEKGGGEPTIPSPAPAVPPEQSKLW